MPFYGESLQVDYAQVIGGADITNDVRLRAGSATLAAGGEWRAWLYPGDATYLLDTDPVVVSWVVEVLSGTVTLDASMGLDPGYGDPAASHPTSLGTHTVTGPATLVLTTTLTAADVVTASTSPMLVLVATSGSAVVQQIKVRAWPPGGAVGAWSSVQPGFTVGSGSTPAFFYGQVNDVFDGSATTTNPEASWNAAVGALATSPTLAALFNDTGSLVIATYASIARGGGDYTADVNSSGAVVVIRGQDWSTSFPIAGTFTEGTDYVRAPEEVQDDFPRWAQQVGDGGTDWIDAYAEVTLGDESGVIIGDPTAHSVASTGALTITGSGPASLAISGAAFTQGASVGSYGSSPSVVTVTLATGGRDIMVSFGHTFDLTTWPGWSPTLDGQVIGEEHAWESAFPEILSRPLLPPYRYWNPALVRPIPLRQFHRDDGLGVTPPRAFGGASRARTGRAFGYD